MNRDDGDREPDRSWVHGFTSSINAEVPRRRLNLGENFIAVIGFSAGWVVTSGAAQEMADKQEEKAVIVALTPICVAQFRSQAADVRATQLATLKGESF